MEPAEVVAALFEAAVAGEDPSGYADGELATLLRLEHDVRTEVESAAGTATVHRLRTVAVEGDSATVELDVETRIAWKHELSGEWEPAASRCRGSARLVRRDGRWLVVDLPSSHGCSALDGARELDEGAPPEGDLRLEAHVETRRSSDSLLLRLRNAGERPLRPVAVLLERRALAVLPVRMRLPFLVERTLAPGGTYAFRAEWKLPLRLGPLTIGVEAEDDAGRMHRAGVGVRPPQRPYGIAVANLWSIRVFELAAATFGVWMLLPSWIVSSFLPGLALAGAGVQRGAVLIALLRVQARGPGIVALAAIAVAESGVGAWLVARDLAPTDAAIVLGSVLFLLVPALRRSRDG